MLASQSLGTGNSQWLVVDYQRHEGHADGVLRGTRFTPGEPLQDNAFRLLEQLPGVSHQAWCPKQLCSDSKKRLFWSVGG